MFGNAFTGWHALILLAIILLLFGAPKLPALAKSLGQSMKILKAEVKSPPADESDADGTGTPPTEVRSESAASDERPEGSQTQHKP